MERHVKKEYTNGTITVKWDSAKCIHSGICRRGLPAVFKPAEAPWIQMGDTDSEKIAEQVKQCPSGALSFYYNKDKKD